MVPDIHQEQVSLPLAWIPLFFLECPIQWWVTIWSFMKLENTHAVVEFIFKGIEPPYMILGQELCMMLLTPDGRVVKKPNNPIINQFLKVLTNVPP